jgi:hypothetical protein
MHSDLKIWTGDPAPSYVSLGFYLCCNLFVAVPCPSPVISVLSVGLLAPWGFLCASSWEFSVECGV